MLFHVFSYNCYCQHGIINLRTIITMAMENLKQWMNTKVYYFYFREDYFLPENIFGVFLFLSSLRLKKMAQSGVGS